MPVSQNNALVRVTFKDFDVSLLVLCLIVVYAVKDLAGIVNLHHTVGQHAPLLGLVYCKMHFINKFTLRIINQKTDNLTQSHHKICSFIGYNGT